MSSPNANFVTPGEYLEQERKSEIRSEYIAGRIFAMSDATWRHNVIAGNCHVVLAGIYEKVEFTALPNHP